MSIFRKSCLVKYKTLIEHLKLLRLKEIRSWSLYKGRCWKISKKRSNPQWSKRRNLNNFDWSRRFRNFPRYIRLGQTTEILEFDIRRSLLINRSIIVIRSYVSFIIIFTGVSICSCRQTEIASTMNHVHRK